MKNEIKVWVVYGIMFLIAWVYSNIVTWKTELNWIPFIVIFVGYSFAILIASIQFYQENRDLFK